MGEVTIAAANGVNFHVKPGEFVVIVGPSGAGKSTILNMLGGIDQNDDGQIIIGGKDLSAMNNKELTLYRRYDIGFVFQFYNLIQNLTAKENVEIALVGKYVELHDAYISVVEALNHGGLANDANVKIEWINAVDVTVENAKKIFKKVDGILVPGGFGDRGVEGKIEAIKYARENNIPFLGICLGMQTAVIEFARNVLGYEGANSSEIDPETKYPVIDLMNDQKYIQDLGGTMRLGAYPCILDRESKSFEVYGEENISERHRHRYEFNNEFRQQISEAGMKIVGTSPDGRLVEIVEIPNHKWFVAAQFHPELKSRPNRPHPLFVGLINAALVKK